MKKYFVPIFFLLLNAFNVYCCDSVTAQEARGPKKPADQGISRFSIPPDIGRDFLFLGQKFPIERPDIRARIIAQINFLVYDARSVLTEWILEKSRFNWIYRETFSKAGLPEDFVWLAPVFAGATRGIRPQGVGVWMIEKSCSSTDGVEMREVSRPICP